MQFKYFIMLFIFLNGSIYAFGKNITITFRLTDATSGEFIIGGTIINLTQNTQTVSNHYGFTTMSIPSGSSVDLIINHLSYQSVSISLKPIADTSFIIKLLAGKENINEVVIQENRPINSLNSYTLDVDQIKKLPRMMGEVDVFKAFQLMPGVQTGREGTSALYVRGGTPDQNLILLDDVPLYYVNHMGGFLSVFDANALKNVTLIKGGFPANYGGRLSSILDVRMKEGDKKQGHKEIGISAIASKLTLDGPLGKQENTSYMISLRRFNFDVFSRLYAVIFNNNEQGGGYTFYDAYGKVTKIINDKHKLDFSIYSGRDKMFNWQDLKNNQVMDAMDYSSKDATTWGNIALSLRWNQLLNPKLKANHTFYYSGFFYKVKNQAKETKGLMEIDYLATLKTGVNDFGLKSDWEWSVHKNHTLQSGFSIINHQFKTGIQFSNVSNNLFSPGENLLHANDFKSYFLDKYDLGSHIIINAGIHFNAYLPKSASYISLQPRVNINLKVNPSNNFQIAYSRMQQNEHLLSNSGTGIPMDIWVPATASVPPQLSDQWSAGYKHEMTKLPLVLSIEGYYKNMTNIIEFNDGANFFAGGSFWEKKVEADGKGNAYGAEVMMQKSKGRITGWIAYTLSYNNRQFEIINQGRSFPYRYDRRHNLNVVLNYEPKPSIQLGMTWTYASGDALTIPLQQYIIPQEDYFIIDDIGTPFYNAYYNIHDYDSRNNFRMPAYHRLDISCNFIKKKERGERIWNLSIYNAYNQQNPYYVYFGVEKTKNINTVHLYQLTMFPAFISFGYSRSW